MKFLEKISIYRIIALIAALIFMVDGFLGNQISSKLLVDANLIKENFELWRFLSYPLAYVTLANAFLGFFAFFFFAPNLRTQLNKGVFDLSILLLTFSIGLILFMLNFNSPNIMVMGIEAISAYIITLYIFVNKRNDIRYFKAVRLTRMAFPLFLLASWAMLYLLETGTAPLKSNIIDQSPAILGLGLISGLIGYFMLKQEKVDTSFIHKTSSFDVREIRDLEPTPAVVESYKVKEYKQSSIIENALEFSEEDPESNEEILNEILEKINENGLESLNEDEKAFLKIYAKSH